MTNREKYLDEILAKYLRITYTSEELSSEFNVPLNEDRLACSEEIEQWLQSEYVEPQEEYVDVLKPLPLGTVIEVELNGVWVEREFAVIIEGYIYCRHLNDFTLLKRWNSARVKKSTVDKLKAEGRYGNGIKL